MLFVALFLTAADLPAFDQVAILQRCAEEHGSNVDGQFGCLKEEMEDHHQFRLLWTHDRPENRAGYRQCLARHWEEGEQPDWGMANFCAERATNPQAEALESGGAFNVKAAAAFCVHEGKERMVSPDGSRREIENAECLSDQAAGHRGFRLMRAQIGKEASGLDAPALDYCYQNWIKDKADEGGSDWNMANFCAHQQYSARLLLNELKSGQ
ncbi:hypothetical protein [Sphingopyxis witflariensis]|nr:hypothetical protein [Sphingopyxis witflariensis]